MSYYGAYYATFVPDENVECPCGEPLQSRDHIIRSCTRYHPHRHELEGLARGTSFSEVLGTTKGIAALAKFLRKSGTFTVSGEPWAPPAAPRFAEKQDADDPRGSEEETEEREEEEEE